MCLIPACEDVLRCVEGRAESLQLHAEKPVGNSTKPVINLLHGDTSSAPAPDKMFYSVVCPIILSVLFAVL